MVDRVAVFQRFIEMSSTKEVIYDVLVVGGGVIGCAVLNELTRRGYKCLLVEKHGHLLTQASSANRFIFSDVAVCSGIAHTGFDAVPGSIESQCIYESRALNATYCTEQGIPYSQIGAIMVAWTDFEMDALVGIEQNAIRNGVTDTRMLSREALRIMEPNLSPLALKGLLIPGEAVVDSWRLPIILAHNAMQHGAKVAVDCAIVSGRQLQSRLWRITSSRDVIKARVVVNAAGLYGDRVEEINKPSIFRIKPRKGQFVVYGSDTGKLLKHIILPVPTEKTKGIIVYPSVYGQLVVGPTAEDCDERESPPANQETAAHLICCGERVVPRLKDYAVIRTYVGLRPATETKDYHLSVNPERSWITVGGIRSTGLTACLAIARRVGEMVEDKINLEPSVKHLVWTARNPDKVFFFPDASSAIIDGKQYKITHPLSQLGLSIKSKL